MSCTKTVDALVLTGNTPRAVGYPGPAGEENKQLALPYGVNVTYHVSTGHARGCNSNSSRSRVLLQWKRMLVQWVGLLGAEDDLAAVRGDVGASIFWAHALVGMSYVWR